MVTAIPFFIAMVSQIWQNQGPIVMFRRIIEHDVLAGQFSLAMQALFISAAVPEALAVAALPVLTRSAKRGDGKDLIYARGLLRMSFLICASAGFIAMAVGPWIFPLVFGEKFATAGALVGPALWCLIPLMAKSALPSVIVARGHFYVAMAGSVTGAITVSILLPLLASKMGAHGALLAAGIGFTMPAVVTISFAVYKGWISIYAILVQPVAAVAAGIGVYLFILPHSLWLATFAALAAMALASLLVQVITKEERGSVRAFIADYRETRRREKKILEKKDSDDA